MFKYNQHPSNYLSDIWKRYDYDTNIFVGGDGGGGSYDVDDHEEEEEEDVSEASKLSAGARN